MSVAPDVRLRVAPTPLVPVGGPGANDGYVPGACNIGAWEIRRRRAFALVGFAAAALLLAVLVAVGAPAVTRLILFLPLMGGAFSWLQARRRFCAAYAWRGVANFTNDDAGVHSVQDEAARRADMAAIGRMARDAALIALPLVVIAVLLPV
jgi:hypothetical protein